ncbi:hypothetical protein KAI04_02865 [Candidatus Pacearchaeota archaeon]|nr:hypothetical protein [Candidatus Pacearchaeota archaeon]
MGKKGQKGMFTKDGKRTAKEKILITVLISAIFLLTFFFGYDLYNSFETKAETDFLNGAVILLSEEKSELMIERDNLSQALDLLTQQKVQLDADYSGLNSELAELKENYATLSGELETAKDDLEDCEALVTP